MPFLDQRILDGFFLDKTESLERLCMLPSLFCSCSLVALIGLLSACFVSQRSSCPLSMLPRRVALGNERGSRHQYILLLGFDDG